MRPSFEYFDRAQWDKARGNRHYRPHGQYYEAFGVTREEWLYGKKCVYCGSPADSVDHIVPRSLGGTSHVSNLAPCCRSCNSRKGSMPARDFVKLVCAQNHLPPPLRFRVMVGESPVNMRAVARCGSALGPVRGAFCGRPSRKHGWIPKRDLMKLPNLSPSREW